MRTNWIAGAGGAAYGWMVSANLTNPETIGNLVTIGSVAIGAVVLNIVTKISAARVEKAKADTARAQADADIAKSHLEMTRADTQIRIVQAQADADLKKIRAQSETDAPIAAKIDQVTQAVMGNRQVIEEQGQRSRAAIRTLARKQGVLTDDTADSARPTDATLAARHGQIVLIVDDDPATLQVYDSFILGGGYGTKTASSVAEAELRLTMGITAVLLDLKLSGEPGERLIDYIEAHHVGVRIIVLTGIEDQPRLTAVRPRVAAVITKPLQNTADFDRVLSELDNRVPAPA